MTIVNKMNIVFLFELYTLLRINSFTIHSLGHPLSILLPYTLSSMSSLGKSNPAIHELATFKKN